MWTKISRNALSNLTGTAVSLLTGFFLMPFTVRHIGATAFGIWVLVNSVVGYMGLLDLGLAPTLVKKSAEYLAEDSKERSQQLSEVISTIFVIYLLIGVVVGVGIAALAVSPDRVFNIPVTEKETFRLVLMIVGLQAALSFPMSIWSGLAASLQDFHFVNALNVCNNLVRAVLTAILLTTRHGLTSLVMMGFAIASFAWIANWVWVRHRIPALRLHVSAFAPSRVPELAQFSGATLIGSLAVYAMSQGDRIVLGMFVPVAVLTVYEVGARLSLYSRNVFGWLPVILPAASSLGAKDDGKLLRELYLGGTRYLLLTYAAIVVVLLGFGRELILLWMGKDFVGATSLMTFLLIGSFYQSQNVVAHMMLLGMGRLRVLTWIMSIYPVGTVLLGVILIPKWGALGMAGALAATMIVAETAFLPYILRVFGCSLLEYQRTCLSAALFPALPCVGWICGVHVWIPATTWGKLIFEVIGCLLVYGITFWSFVASPGERKAIWVKIMQFLRRTVSSTATDDFPVPVAIHK